MGDVIHAAESLTDPTAPLYVTSDGGIGRIILNRPSKKNALNLDMWARLKAAVDRLDADATVRLVLVQSNADGSFSTGADISEFEAMATNESLRERQRQLIREGQRALARMKKPTIAVIDGFCVGAGCGIAIHCDFRLASDRSKFGITPAKLGLVYPLNDTRHLVDLVGPSNAKKVLFTARLFDGAESYRMGLVDSLVPQQDLAAEVADWSETISGLSHYSIRGMKEMIRRILDGQVDDDAETSRWFTDAHGGKDYSEGVAAFMEKRAPRFTWND